MAKWEEPAILGMKRISRAERAGLAPLSCFRGSGLVPPPRERRGEADKEPYFMRGHDGLEILLCGIWGRAVALKCAQRKAKCPFLSKGANSGAFRR